MSSSLYGGRGPTGKMGAPSGYRQGQLQKYGPQEMNLHNQLAGMAKPDSYLSRLAGGDEELFNQIEAPALRQFGQLQSATASRFSGVQPGEMSGRRGSGFQNTLGGQQQEFSERLQANRMGLQHQAIGDLRDLIDQLLERNNPKQNYLVPKREKKPSGWGGLFGGAVGAAGGYAAGGGSGALKGAQLGYNVGSQF